MVQSVRGRPPVNALIRRDGRGGLSLELWLPPPPPGSSGGIGGEASSSTSAASATNQKAETPSGEVPSIAPGATPEQRRLWFADLLFNREREFFARLASEAAAAIEASAPAWQVPVSVLLKRLDELERREREQQLLQQQFGNVGLGGGGTSSSSPSPSRSPHHNHNHNHNQGFGGGGPGPGSAASASSTTLGLRAFAWPKELCSTESNAARAAAQEKEDGGGEDDEGASSPSAKTAANAGAATTTTTSMAMLLRAECLSHIPHMRVVSAQIGGEAFFGV